MPIISDHKEEIVAAYNQVRDDNDPIDWILMEYEDGKNQINITQKGSSGYKELYRKFKPDLRQYAYCKYRFATDALSQHPKFIFIVWCGPEVTGMKKAKMSVHVPDLYEVFKIYSIEIRTEDMNDLKEPEIMKRLKAASGAKY